jgi:hypothetical protein
MYKEVVQTMRLLGFTPEVSTHALCAPSLSLSLSLYLVDLSYFSRRNRC